MAPSKSSAFVVCGGISVETVVTGTERRRGTSTKARSTAAGLSESLYADLLWDCGGANVENEAARGLPSSTEAAPDDDFADVFGGPPKFATLSSQLFFKRGSAKVSDTCSTGLSIFQSFASIVPPMNCTSAFNASNGPPRLCSLQEAPGNLAPLSTSAKFTKPRLTTEAEFSSRTCHSDNDNKVFSNRKEGAAPKRDQISPMVPQEPCTMVMTTSTPLMRRESSRSDVGEDAKGSRSRGLKPCSKDFATMKENIQESLKGIGDEPCTMVMKTSTPLRRRESPRSDVGEDAKGSRSRGSKPCSKDFATMKENIQESLKGIGDEHKEQLPSIHVRMASSSRGFHEASQKSTCSTQKAEKWRHSLKIKKNRNADDLWVTIKDVQCATELSKFPPPSRTPPSPRVHSGVTVIIKDTYEVVNNADDCITKTCQSSQKESYSDSGSLSSFCSQESCAKTTFDSRDRKDAMEMAELKIRMVLEARERAKLMVEKKLRERQRARQHKARIETECKLGKEYYCKEHPSALDDSKVRYCEDDVDKQDQEGLRKMDLTRQYIERTTHDVQSKSAAANEKRAIKSRASPDSFERPVEDSNKDASAKSGIDRMTAEVEAAPRWSDTNAGPPRRFSHKAVPEEEVDEDDIFVSKEQQQVSFSSSWCCTKQKRFCEAAGLGKVGSLLRTHKDLNLFPEIIGETFERRKARWDRHCQTAERMAKALEEKKLRDLELEKERAERDKAGEMLDEEIKSWAAGKEGNLEALLCSLHYVLWPECGWVQVSPADLSSSAAVRKAYRRATLCVHPDKVQQKGATIAQKYIAEKIFDLLKDASAKLM